MWLILSGRGWGKTRTGAEWLAYQAVNNERTRWAVIAPTFADARDTCVEGESGLQSILNRYRMIHKWNRSLGELDLRNGSKIKLFSAEEPERLRGPQHHGAWCDELAAWRYDDAWTQLQFGLRLGDTPQTVVTTTPKPRKLIRGLLARTTTQTTTGSTFDNSANLSATALEELRTQYEGTRTGRQELYGELLDDVEGALWTWALLDDYRVTHTPNDVVRRVVAVDPAITFTQDSDETGIITAAITSNGHIYIERDASTRDTVDGWARTVCIEYERSMADAVIIEANQGGDMNQTIIRQVDPNVNVRQVNATSGKRLRAEPVAALAEQGKIHHVGAFPDLEEQLTTWTPADRTSPDRLDALVHAVTALTSTRTPQPVQLLRT